jgi:hypothetical protein
MWEWRYSCNILDHGTRRRQVVNFTPQPLYSQEKSARYLLNTRLRGPRSWSGRQESNSRHPARRYTDWVIVALSKKTIIYIVWFFFQFINLDPWFILLCDKRAIRITQTKWSTLHRIRFICQTRHEETLARRGWKEGGNARDKNQDLRLELAA